MAVITVRQLTKRYRVKVRDPGLAGAVRALFRPRYRAVEAVADLSFQVEAGEIVGFLGPNGAGKTTTLKMLTGLLHPTEGEARVAGYAPWRAGADFKRRIALVLGNKQQLVWDLPPEETFLLNRAIYGLSWDAYHRSLGELVELLGLEPVLDKPVRQLSLGERMKCELAASLLHRPDLLFLDEPTLGLDLTAQETIRSFLRSYRERHGATVLLTSHYMADVTALAPRVVIINQGRLLYDGGLGALAERVAPVRRIELVLQEPPSGDGARNGGRGTDVRTQGLDRERLSRYGRLLEWSLPRVVLEVPRAQVARTSAALLAALPVVDLAVREPPIEEVIGRAFRGETGSPEGGASPPGRTGDG